MPRDRQPPPLSFAAPTTALIASASRKDLRSKKGQPTKITSEQWQPMAWYYYDTIGEYYYAMNWVGNLLSRATLIITKNGKPVSSGPAVDALNSLFGGPEKQPEMLRQLGIHLAVAGEGYLVGESQGAQPDKWYIVANTRMQVSGSGTSAVYTANAKVLTNPLVCRIYRPHPVWPELATSSTRPVLPILSQLDRFGMRLAADLDSRLTGNGILLFPSEVNFPSQPIEGQNGEEPTQTRTGVDGIQDQLIRAASVAMQSPESAAAKVPLAMTMQGDRIAEVRHITFWSEFDDATQGLITDTIRRLALGLDMPPEALTGTGDMNHWNAWQLEDAAIKVHTEPLLQLITSSLTEGYLWPALQDQLGEDARQYSIDSNTVDLRIRPNRSKEAIELYDRGELSAEAMLRENGFNPDGDRMRGEDLKTWLARKLALGAGSATPDQIQAVAKVLGDLQLPGAVPAATDEQKGPRALPSTVDHPTHEPPNGGDVPPELVAAGEVLVFRALERAGNRLKTKGGKAPDGYSAYNLYQVVPYALGDIDDLLADAWGACELFSMGFCQDRLDAYARSLLASKQPHSREMLAKYLADAA